MRGVRWLRVGGMVGSAAAGLLLLFVDIISCAQRGDGR